jgi:hypothetical protein
MTMKKTGREIPEAEWAQLMVLQAREDQLQAMLPSGLNDFIGLDADQLDSKLADIEMIAAEMLAVGAAQQAILEGLLKEAAK